MKPILAAAMLAATANLATAQESDDTRFRQIAECTAFFSVSSGMDGNSQVAPEAAAIISALASELMFEASILGYDDDRAHTAVVERLMDQNALVNERGTEALAASHGSMCAALAKTVQPVRP